MQQQTGFRSAPWRTLLGLLLLAASACMARPAARESASSARSHSTPAPPPPPNQAECAKCNGVWGRHGLSQAEYCNCRTNDSGKRCRDGAECEGQCVADEEPEREIVRAGPPALGYFVGHCSEMKRVFGCLRFIPRGAQSAPPSELAEPLPKLCID